MIVDVNMAAELIRSGEVVALPTETVYGLAADAYDVVAIQKIFNLKKRPTDNPLIVHIANIHQAKALANTDSDLFLKLTDAFWPGPLTLVLPKKPQVLDIITAGLDTVALRMPDHPKMLAVIRQAGPVAAPSANRSGRPSPTRPEHVTDDFNDDLPVVDGGASTIGIESTVLDLSSGAPTILRPGRITTEEIEEIIGTNVLHDSPEKDQLRRSPGTRYSHYKPEASVKWMTSFDKGELHRADCLYIYHMAPPDVRLDNIVSFDGNYKELARSLYDLYRTADKKNYSNIFIEPFQKTTRSPILPALLNRIQRSVSQ